MGSGFMRVGCLVATEPVTDAQMNQASVNQCLPCRHRHPTPRIHPSTLAACAAIKMRIPNRINQDSEFIPDGQRNSPPAALWIQARPGKTNFSHRQFIIQ
jgi:hypothetical protein